MPEKLTEQLTTKVTETMGATFTRLANVDGVSASDLLRSLIEAHIQKKHHEFMLLSKAFEGQGNVGNEVNQ